MLIAVTRLLREQRRNESKWNASCPAPARNVTAFSYYVRWRATNVKPGEFVMYISFNSNAGYWFYWVIYAIIGLPWAQTCNLRAGIQRCIVSKTLHFSQVHSRSVYLRCAPTQQIYSCQNELSVGKRKRGNNCEVHFESEDRVMYARGFIRKHILQRMLHLQHPLCIDLDRKYLMIKRKYDYIK